MSNPLMLLPEHVSQSQNRTLFWGIHKIFHEIVLKNVAKIVDKNIAKKVTKKVAKKVAKKALKKANDGIRTHGIQNHNLKL